MGNVINNCKEQRLSMFVWVLFEFSSFFPLSKNILIGGLDMLKCP